jgi:hypothetical protein
LKSPPKINDDDTLAMPLVILCTTEPVVSRIMGAALAYHSVMFSTEALTWTEPTIKKDDAEDPSIISFVGCKMAMGTDGHPDKSFNIVENVVTTLKVLYIETYKAQSPLW